MVKVYQRRTGQVVEPTEYKAGLLDKLYGTAWGRFLLPILTRPSLSYLLTLKDYTAFSRKKIAAFVENYQLDLVDYEDGPYSCFSAFFQRKIKPELRLVCPDSQVLAVADAKLEAFAISQYLQLTIKGQIYSLADLLLDDELAQLFTGGTALVYRLGVEDLHRYLAAESGRITHSRKIKGRLHTVRQVAQKWRLIYKENKREYCLLDTDLGPVLQMEVGALLVGKIYNHSQDHLVRGQEKGCFGLGGSTILVLYPAGTIRLDQDILTYSDLGIETQIQMGEKIGEKLCLND
ncbi:phosphatidylserine decarboxylase [Streptococcus gordonii]|uniref:phosphatidylserine decarboxylase n=1 Tax=Streptococcus gordonii TaxID=1302 RepID=UPI00228507E9|nr:phosphatidylserine decarboxylase [Streptococcus gordonii]MCY7146840.1 phosphatidylserine decarboxylase [Streptococcus gordonii]